MSQCILGQGGVGWGSLLPPGGLLQAEVGRWASRSPSPQGPAAGRPAMPLVLLAWSAFPGSEGDAERSSRREGTAVFPTFTLHNFPSPPWEPPPATSPLISCSMARARGGGGRASFLLHLQALQPLCCSSLRWGDPQP